MTLPTISAIIPTYNSAKTLGECLTSIFQQEYDSDKIEVIIVDGGSTDNTIAIAKSFGLSPIEKIEYRDDPEIRKWIGFSSSKGELILFIDSDNVIPHKSWLKKMMAPLMNSDAIASQPLYFQYNKLHPPLVRYFALIGIGDPVVYYFGKSDHLSWKDSPTKLPGALVDKGDYYEATFNELNMPTLGANGFLIKREIMMKANCIPEQFFHIDINLDLVKLGYNKYALIKDTIIHLSGKSIIHFLGRRLEYMKKYAKNPSRRYLVYSPTRTSDRKLLLKYIVFSLTVIKPLIDSFSGYHKVPDTAWFLHPVMCFCTLLVYGSGFIRSKFS